MRSNLRLWLRRSFPLGSGLALAFCAASCSKPQIISYQAPKEKAEPATAAAAMPGQPDGAGGDMSANQQFAPVARAPLTWKEPAAWTQLPGDQMRAAAFSLAGENGAKADVTIIPLPALGETDLQNVNRWRNQLGLPPATEAELAPLMGSLKIDGEPGKFFDIGAPPPSAARRILVAQQKRGDVEWFIKMTGDDALVQSQRAAFLEFVQGLQFGNATAALPDGWRSVEPGPMQAAKFATASGAEATTAVFPGDVGGVLANVNRWRKQIQLPPLSEDDLESQMQPVPKIPGGVIADFTSTDQTQRVIAIVAPRTGETAFYKLTGAPSAVQAERARFIQFAENAR